MYLAIRRIVELALILGALPVVLPVGLLVAFLVRFDSQGPVLFFQKRPGRDGRPFEIIKFRTMTSLQHENFVLTSRADSRVSRIGHFLRKYKLDELPQLINVLKGDMSLIGPRPEPLDLSKIYEEQIPGYALRRSVTPGITGLAQVTQGYTETIEETAEKLRYDLHYIYNISPALDCKILLKTLTAVLRGKNSR